MEPVMCPYCGREAEKVGGDVMYPSRPDLADRQFYRCLPCDASVGVNVRTGLPLGTLADRALRRARMAAHESFDQLWKDGGMDRGAAYEWLSRKLGIPKDDCHIGRFDADVCRRVVAECRREKSKDDDMPF